MKYFNELQEILLCIVNKTNRAHKAPTDFGTGQLLYNSEIHTIVTIGSHGELNSNELAKVLGITNGAVTQMTNKLVLKGLVEKYKVANSKKEVYLRLTEQGRIAEQGHSNIHDRLYKAAYEFLDSLNESQIETIKEFLFRVSKNLLDD